MKKLIVVLACLVVGCAWRDWPAQEPLSDTAPGGTSEDCGAMCAKLDTLPDGCGMVPRSMSCAAACARQMSAVDDRGDPIITLRPKCVAQIETCADIDRCEVSE